MGNLLKNNKKLMNEYNFEKNKSIDLRTITLGSSKKIWWKCGKGHEWQAIIKTRCNGANCPFCTNKKVLRGYNDLKAKSPELAKEWNYKKNGSLKPSDILYGSHKSVWWRCKRGHEWKASVKSRYSGCNCPFCTNKKVLQGYNDLKTIKPELAKEWNYEKNGSLKPSNVLYGSHKSVWWKCKKEHEWKVAVGKRFNGSNCPYCANHTLLEGYNDLMTTNPGLAKEWNYEKNGCLTPKNAKEGSHTSVWWRCKKGHEYKAPINQRASGSNCPYCANRKLLIGYNDLATLNPELAKEWNYERNGLLKPSDVMPGSQKKVWWKCERGHEYKTQISVRTGGHNCPICNDEAQTSLPERIVYYYIKKYIPSTVHNYTPKNFYRKSLDIYIPNLLVAIEYDGSYFHQDSAKDLEKDSLCEKNNIKLYRIRESKLSKIKYKSNSIKIFLKDNSYSSLEEAIELILNELNIVECDINIERDLDMIYQFINFTEKDNSLLDCNPNLAKEWNYERNGLLKPGYVKKRSGKRVWWKCSECGHEWQATVHQRSRGTGCPVCYKKRKVKIAKV